MRANFDDLPIHRYRESILQAIRAHSCVIICGETGSGKSTQIPQWLWREILPEGGRRLIAHTQPRRVAAISLARRIQEEINRAHLNPDMPPIVGHKVRFDDRILPSTRIALVTDGILIAETAHDPQLRQYDALIIDEAHERSLNIDFLLGYLRNLIAHRPELKVIITSATLDTEKFSNFFHQAPVINVEGRSFPVEIRYQPLESAPDKNTSEEQQEQREAWREDKREERLPQAIAQSIETLWNEALGDVLVFLPGEHEIRTVMRYLQGTILHGRWQNAQILPLMARLSNAEQMKIFNPEGSSVRIILSTNIAETSLTVPRIRYVIDSGLARVLRYSPRTKINRLEIEPIAQDSAKQRSGRCGRIAQGVCIRLYDEASFLSRPLQSTPEILRTSLSMVILRLLSLQWGDVRAFPWIDPPSPRAIHHGLQELTDLGAIDHQNALTPLGMKMAKFAVDHTLSRILIAAHDRQVLSEILIIVAGLSTREVRELPLSAEDRARTIHRQFEDETSDFLTLINLWRAIETARENAASNRAFRDWCRAHYLSWLRIREWRELHLQLQTQIKRLFPLYRLSSPATLKLSTSMEMATIKAIHQSILCGVPAQIGKKHDTEMFYQGPRGLKFFANRQWANRKARWILCGEIIATPQPTARRIAKIEPQWIIEALPDLIEIKGLALFWDQGQQAVMRHRQVSLYGLMIEPRQRVRFYAESADEEAMASECFIRGALIEAQARLPAPYSRFLEHNQQAIATLIERENRWRRPGALISDEQLLAFYRNHLAAFAHQITHTQDFIKTLKANPDLVDKLTINVDTWMDSINDEGEDYPGTWVAGELRLPIRYTFAPNTPADGISVTLAESLLPLLPRYLGEWLVPGLLTEKVQSLLNTLPKRLKIALKGHAETFVKTHRAQNKPLCAVLAQSCSQALRQPLAVGLFREEQIPNHLKMRYLVTRSSGAVILDTRNIGEIEPLIRPQAPAKIPPGDSPTNQKTTVINSSPIVSWDASLGEMPRRAPIVVEGQTIQGYAVFVATDQGIYEHCLISEEEALRHHRQGLIALARHALSAQIKSFLQRPPTLLGLQCPTAWFADDRTLQNTILDSAIAQCILSDPLPDTSARFNAQVALAKSKMLLIAQTLVAELQTLAQQYKTTQQALQKTANAALADDCQTWLSSLYPQDFLIHGTPLKNLLRYTRAINIRLENFAKNPDRDNQNTRQLRTLASQIARAEKAHQLSESQRRQLFEMMLELRVSLYAEKVGTAYPISIRRIEKFLSSL